MNVMGGHGYSSEVVQGLECRGLQIVQGPECRGFQMVHGLEQPMQMVDVNVRNALSNCRASGSNLEVSLKDEVTGYSVLSKPQVLMVKTSPLASKLLLAGTCEADSRVSLNVSVELDGNGLPQDSIDNSTSSTVTTNCNVILPFEVRETHMVKGVTFFGSDMEARMTEAMEDTYAKMTPPLDRRVLTGDQSEQALNPQPDRLGIPQLVQGSPVEGFQISVALEDCAGVNREEVLHRESSVSGSKGVINNLFNYPVIPIHDLHPFDPGIVLAEMIDVNFSGWDANLNITRNGSGDPTSPVGEVAIVTRASEVESLVRSEQSALEHASVAHDVWSWITTNDIFSSIFQLGEISGDKGHRIPTENNLEMHIVGKDKIDLWNDRAQALLIEPMVKGNFTDDDLDMCLIVRQTAMVMELGLLATIGSCAADLKFRGLSKEDLRVSMRGYPLADNVMALKEDGQQPCMKPEFKKNGGVRVKQSKSYKEHAALCNKHIIKLQIDGDAIIVEKSCLSAEELQQLHINPIQLVASSNPNQEGRCMFEGELNVWIMISWKCKSWEDM